MSGITTEQGLKFDMQDAGKRPASVTMQVSLAWSQRIMSNCCRVTRVIVKSHSYIKGTHTVIGEWALGALRFISCIDIG